MISAQNPIFIIKERGRAITKQKIHYPEQQKGINQLKNIQV